MGRFTYFKEICGLAAKSSTNAEPATVDRFAGAPQSPTATENDAMMMATPRSEFAPNDTFSPLAAEPIAGQLVLPIRQRQSTPNFQDVSPSHSPRSAVYPAAGSYPRAYPPASGVSEQTPRPEEPKSAKSPTPKKSLSWRERRSQKAAEKKEEQLLLKKRDLEKELDRTRHQLNDSSTPSDRDTSHAQRAVEPATVSYSAEQQQHELLRRQAFELGLLQQTLLQQESRPPLTVKPPKPFGMVNGLHAPQCIQQSNLYTFVAGHYSRACARKEIPPGYTLGFTDGGSLAVNYEGKIYIITEQCMFPHIEQIKQKAKEEEERDRLKERERTQREKVVRNEVPSQSPRECRQPSHPRVRSRESHSRSNTPSHREDPGKRSSDRGDAYEYYYKKFEADCRAMRKRVEEVEAEMKVAEELQKKAARELLRVEEEREASRRMVSEPRHRYAPEVPPPYYPAMPAYAFASAPAFGAGPYPYQAPPPWACPAPFAPPMPQMWQPMGCCSQPPQCVNPHSCCSQQRPKECDVLLALRHLSMMRPECAFYEPAHTLQAYGRDPRKCSRNGDATTSTTCGAPSCASNRVAENPFCLPELDLLL